MKFKIGFTIDAEALFGLMAKMLPIDDLSVEELEPPKPPVARIAQPAAKAAQPARPKLRRRGGKFHPDSGINRVILEALADGKSRTAVSLRPTVKAMGFSATSVSPRLDALKRKGLVFQPEFGLWQIVDARQAKAAE